MLSYPVTILLCLLVGLSVPQVVTLALLVRRRKLQPIRYRGVWLLVLSGAATFVAFVWYMLFLMLEVSGEADDNKGQSDSSGQPAHRGPPTGLRRYFCGDYQWILWIANACIMGGYAIRSLRIIKIFHDHTAWVSPVSLQQQLNAEHLSHVSAIAMGTASSDGNGPLLSASNVSMLSLGLNPRRLQSRVYTERSMLLLMLLLLALLSALKAGMDRSSLPLDYSGFGCGDTKVWGWLAVAVAELLFFLVAIWKLRSIRDDYGTATELTGVAVIWALSTAGLAVSVALRHSSVAGFFGGGGEEDSETYVEFQAALWAARNLAIFATSFMWPLVCSYRHSFPPLWSNSDALCSLDTLLKDIVCITYFRNYLASIGRVEWILAWVEMELFRDFEGEAGEGGVESDADQAAIAEHAKRIYAKYVQLGAELEVHLQPSTVHLVTREVHVGNPGPECFYEAQAELFQLMEAEFPRFLSSPHCEACLHELEKEEVLREVLEKSGMI